MSNRRARRGIAVQQVLLTTVATLLAVGSVSAQPQAPAAAMRRPPPLVNGTVEAMEHGTLIVDTAGHHKVSVALPSQTRIVEQVAASLDDVKVGEFIGATAVQGPDGKLRATEIHIFPENLRGSGEGHFPMGAPLTTMTNGNVEAVAGDIAQSAASSGGAERLNISYKGGRSDVVVPPNVTVTQMRPADVSVLKPGRRVTVQLAAGAHAGAGAVSAATVFVHEADAH